MPKFRSGKELRERANYAVGQPQYSLSVGMPSVLEMPLVISAMKTIMLLKDQLLVGCATDLVKECV